MKLLQRLATTSAVIAGAVLTAPSASAEDVDLEMVLLIDTSGSVDDDEFDQQMKGYINAFRDEEVQEAVLSHPNGVAVQVAQWSRGDNFATLDWQVLRTEEDCRALATSIFFFSRVEKGGTQMAPAIDKAMQALSTNNYDSPRQVIDVSGDGVCENWLFETTGQEHHDLNPGRPWSEVLADRPSTLAINGIAIGAWAILNSPKSEAGTTMCCSKATTASRCTLIRSRRLARASRPSWYERSSRRLRPSATTKPRFRLVTD